LLVVREVVGKAHVEHDAVLLRAGMVARRKNGNFSVYSIADDAIFSLCEEVCGGLRRQVSELDALLKGGS